MAGPGGVTGPVAVGAGPGAVPPGAAALDAGGAGPGVGSDDDDEQATPRSAQVRNTKESEEEDRPIQAVGNVTVTQA